MHYYPDTLSGANDIAYHELGARFFTDTRINGARVTRHYFSFIADDGSLQGVGYYNVVMETLVGCERTYPANFLGLKVGEGKSALLIEPISKMAVRVK